MSFSEAGLPALLSREAGPATPHHKLLINVFLVLQILGLIGSVALVLTTTLSSRSARNSTWQNFFTSWIISTVSYSLLLFAGQVNQREPAFGVCLAQAGLIYGIPSLTAATTFGLIGQIWFNVQALLAHKIKHERLMTAGLLILPYVILFLMVIASWVVGIRNPDLVVIIGSGMYCHIGPSGTLGKVSAALVALTLLPTLALEIMICISLRRNWTTFRRMKNSLSIIVRVMIFTLFGILAIGLSGIFVFSESHGAALNIVFATMPVVAVIVFATQKDIILVWMFWKKRPEPEGKMLSSRSSNSSAPV
ncbi:hypothetical protein B0H17DRAFT_1085926 [Mycena rosella]|uniref:Uncharacterized protein n=1 Tax=Mycena rosella TaxID=1033263 RepID=A0AAD7GA44_MYCRO|nr:hypothetical protein B0H17DRAFT_1085926 [Mycena rosella]